MTDKDKATVSIKRLSHCFQLSERTKKIRSAISYLDMFPAEKPETLHQFDEQPKKHYSQNMDGVYDDSISDKDLNDFLKDGDIPNLMNDENFRYTDKMVIIVPKRATEGAAGYDLQAAIDDSITISPGEHKIVPTGLSVSMPNFLELQIRPRSGLAAKNGITVLNSPGTIDSDYGGEIKVILINHGKTSFTINRGDRIAQGVFNIVALPVLNEVDSLEETTRGSGGFGSTGR